MKVARFYLYYLLAFLIFLLYPILMIVLGYEVAYNRLSYKDQLKLEESTYAMPSFGLGYWTFNNPVWSKFISFREKRIVIAREKGLYIHIWLFSNRFDIDFRKWIPYES